MLEIQARPIIHSYPVDHGRRLLAWQFVENLAERILAQDLINEQEFRALSAELKAHLEDPDTFVISCLFVQAWGRIAG